MRLFANASVHVVAVMLLLLGANRVAMSEDPDFDKLQAKRQILIELFEQRNFEQLDQRLNAVQVRYESGELSDSDLWDYFGWVSTFGLRDPEAFDERLSAWATQKPQSYPAHLARGIFYVGRGFEARGTNYAADTSAVRFHKMRSWFERGRKDLVTSLGLTSKPLLSHAWLQSIALAAADAQEREAFFNQAIRYAPDSYLIRTNYMRGLLPRWGGSYEQMEQFARDSEAVLGPGDVANGLWNMIAEDRAGALLETEKFAPAKTMLSEALERRDSAQLLCMRATANASLDRFEEAMADLQRTMKYTGEHDYCASVVSWIASFAGADPRIDALLSAYIARNPGYTELYLRRGYLRQGREDSPGAFEDFEIAASMGNQTAKIHVAQFLLNGWGGIEKNPDRGLALLRETAETGEPYAKHVLNEAVKVLGLESEEQARRRHRQKSMQRLRPVKSTWDIQQAKTHWGVGRLTDHRVIASVLGALVMMGWLRKDRRKG